MIPASKGAPHRDAWQGALADAFTDPQALLTSLGLDQATFGLTPDTPAFPMRVPRGFAARMRHGDPKDPLLRQVLPLADELTPAPGFVADPLDEADARSAPGILQKYRGRALLVLTGACAVHCRYCFRREYPYAEHALGRSRLDSALQHLRASPDVGEIILSGGDPLSLSNARLAELVSELEGIPHLHTLRVHTRLPVVLPERIDAGLCVSLESRRLRRVMVLHANHANELAGEGLTAALRRLSDCGFIMLNQSVLLRGVNDTADALVDLSHALFEHGVLPYYLHLLDPIRGTAHFEVAPERAILVHREAAARLPGYLVPRLVREVAGAPAKMPIEFGARPQRAGEGD